MLLVRRSRFRTVYAHGHLPTHAFYYICTVARRILPFPIGGWICVRCVTFTCAPRTLLPSTFAFFLPVAFYARSDSPARARFPRPFPGLRPPHPTTPRCRCTFTFDSPSACYTCRADITTVPSLPRCANAAPRPHMPHPPPHALHSREAGGGGWGGWVAWWARAAYALPALTCGCCVHVSFFVGSIFNLYGK